MRHMQKFFCLLPDSVCIDVYVKIRIYVSCMSTH